MPAFSLSWIAFYCIRWVYFFKYPNSKFYFSFKVTASNGKFRSYDKREGMLCEKTTRRNLPYRVNSNSAIG